ncbi:hypothetical protein SKAU_G00340040 [Synaphobranchus kaupii]|uniref:Uncharacterized protein n=1 Tax=Synaphobranchus kaupii TaxID=118154 RepID=A0A9Q1IH58_SYNKA|nr:hypothetical protein SKAU_G00340040 [Synaphobranchus kaupii]
MKGDTVIPAYLRGSASGVETGWFEQALGCLGILAVGGVGAVVSQRGGSVPSLPVTLSRLLSGVTGVLRALGIEPPHRTRLSAYSPGRSGLLTVMLHTYWTILRLPSPRPIRYTPAKPQDLTPHMFCFDWLM